MLTTTPKSLLRQLFEFIKTLVIAGFLAFFVIRGFIFEPFRIPSTSMMPNLEIGDFLFISKFAYGNRIPYTDIFLWQKEVSRGDIVVFRREGSGLPGSFFGLGPTFFIKRVVAVPGDTIAYNDKTLIINGEPAHAEPLGEVTYTTAQGTVVKAQKYAETVANQSRNILKNPLAKSLDLTEITVPAGEYVLMGDNRDNSHDARFWRYPNWGFVPYADIMGRAEFIFFSWDKNFMPRFDRLLDSLRSDH